jgi:hypothetical protein
VSESIVLSSATWRLRAALDLLAACSGIATSDGTSLDVMPAPVDRPLTDYLPTVKVPEDDSILRILPAGVTVAECIQRAADEARHAAQETLDEIAHARGWPR